MPVLYPPLCRVGDELGSRFASVLTGATVRVDAVKDQPDPHAVLVFDVIPTDHVGILRIRHDFHVEDRSIAVVPDPDVAVGRVPPL